MQPNLGMACAVLGSLLVFSFGIWSESLTLLLLVMGVDYLTGVIASLREGKGLNSSIGFWGLGRKGLMLLVVLIAHRIDVLLGENIAMGGAIYFYIVNELLSIMENYGRMGLPLPDRLRKAVQILRDRSGNGSSEPPGKGDPPAK
ncbi:phage holin family protein [Cohnella xylanilytica]|uniref:Phage holin family protein n=1 Tax=Cohnella xylanilytica TaxID=557555 RepID=A0A841TXF4_9BACL|nr:phage holin family protein [Cohnella xylanilytica]MBB6690621.1 phage holin family protein [Cohnella xylanilytica]